MVKRYSFICAHPDDLEMFSGMFIRWAVQKGHDVEIVSMTKGEWGTLDPRLKGDKLAAIRVRELAHAAQLHGVPAHKIKYLGLIDGDVTLPKALKVLRSYFEVRKPDVVFVPEYSFSVYVHPDHLNTGKATCILFKREFQSPRPLLFTYHSFKNNTYLPTQMRATGKAIAAHKTQVQVIIYLLPFRYLYDLLNGFFYCRRFLFMESARRIYFTKKIKISFLDRLFSAAFSLGKFIFKAWSPIEAEKIS
jgi:LmbE family N-acetylglucosaminyl deacetylase